MAMDKKGQPEELTWESLERQDWHLWLLAILLMFVLGISLLSFMLPAAFWFGDQSVIESPQRAFFGFCVLLALVLVYLLQRQANLRRLKRQLFVTQAALAAAERNAGIQVFQALPDLNQFRDVLAMEFRRAASSGTNLAGAVLAVPDASPEAIARMASLLRGLLRRGESLYRVSDKGIGVVLPGMKLSDVASFVEQIERLSGIGKDRIEASLTAFPDEVHSLAELEGRLRGVYQPSNS